ncbi:MAG: hypothetical protein ACOYEQ_06290 [Bacillota bacterium]
MLVSPKNDVNVVILIAVEYYYIPRTISSEKSDLCIKGRII